VVEKSKEEPIFEDSEIGASKALEFVSMLKSKDVAKWTPDRYVAGVWKAMLTDEARRKHHGTSAVLIYLKGYKDRFGKIRNVNDFEELAAA
jgi:hypothetical protein